jgi:opacity protein-like surface antigen
MMKSVFLSLFILTSFSVSCWAGSFSFDFNNHSTQLGYIQQLQQQPYGEMLAKVRYLYNDSSDTNLLGLAVGVLGSPGNVDGLKLGIDLAVNGGRTANSDDVLAFGVGLLTQYSPPALAGFGVDAHFVYSPEIFTYKDSEDYLEWGVGVNYQVLPNAKITLGYQDIQVKLKNAGNHDLDNTVRVGVIFTF